MIASNVQIVKPHRGILVLSLGAISLVIAGSFSVNPISLPMILGPLAWIMGIVDLRRMRDGHMDRTGEGMTVAGKTCGLISTIVSYTIFAMFTMRMTGAWIILWRAFTNPFGVFGN